MAYFIRPFTLIKCLGNTSWPRRSSKEIPLFIEDVTERTCGHYSLGCLEIRSRSLARHVFAVQISHLLTDI